jgi:hypothetical protein
LRSPPSVMFPSLYTREVLSGVRRKRPGVGYPGRNIWRPSSSKLQRPGCRLAFIGVVLPSPGTLRPPKAVESVVAESFEPISLCGSAPHEGDSIFSVMTRRPGAPRLLRMNHGRYGAPGIARVILIHNTPDRHLGKMVCIQRRTTLISFPFRGLIR